MRVQVFGDRNWAMCPNCEWGGCAKCDGTGYIAEDVVFIQDTLANATKWRTDGYITLIHGNARGADKFGGRAGKALDMTIEVYEADWARYGKGAGPIRNQQMLDSGIDLALGFHADISTSKGSKDMLYRLNRAGIEVRLYGKRQHA